MRSTKLFLLFLLIISFSSSCKKNPAEPQIEIPIELREERILFERGGQGLGNYSEFGTMKPDGSGINIIYRHSHEGEYYPEGFGNPRWSPDKTKFIVYGPTMSLEYRSLWLMDINGTPLHQLTWNGFMHIWSKDGKHILFERGRGYFSSIYDVYSVNPDGTDEKMIYQVGDSTHFYLSDVSVSGEYILGYELIFYKDDKGRLSETDFEIVKINLLTGEKVYLTDNNLSDGWPIFNYDETMIAYNCRDVKGNVTSNDIQNIYIMNSDGSNKKRVTNEITPNQIYPPISWSPDGKKIAYCKIYHMRFAPDVADIFIVDILSGNSCNLTNTAKDSISSGVYDWK